MLRFFQNIYQRRAARAMFSRWSPIYEDDVVADQYSAADKVAAAVIKYLGLGTAENPLIADVGIGTGLLAQQIYDALPCRITGIDFSEDMMSVALQKEITELLLKFDAGKEPWPFTPASYDAVVSAGLLEYFTPDMTQHFMQQSAKILKPEGCLIFTYVPTDKAPQTVDLWHGKSGKFLSCAYAPETLMQWMSSAGFNIVDHTEPFAGSVFRDGSTYPYRLIAAKRRP